MDTAKIEAGVRLILEGVGEDPEREGLRETLRHLECIAMGQFEMT